jgi:CRISPR-associated protein Cas2
VARVNRYRGVLQPRQVGRVRGESPVLLLYDIEDDRIRNRVAEICLDCGLERIQFSAFFGRLTQSRREELTLRVLNEVEGENARVRLMPLTEQCLGEMWEYDHWRLDAEQLKAAAEGALPRIRFVKVEE